MIEVRFVPATMEHAVELALQMRPADRAEVLALGAASPMAALEASLATSTTAYTVLFDGKVAAMLGSGPTDLPLVEGAVGCAWALTSEEVTRHPMTFARHSKEALSMLWNDFDWLANWVDASYASALAWLERLGFKVLEPKPVGINGALFCLCILGRS